MYLIFVSVCRIFICIVGRFIYWTSLYFGTACTKYLNYWKVGSNYKLVSDFWVKNPFFKNFLLSLLASLRILFLTKIIHFVIVHYVWSERNKLVNQKLPVFLHSRRGFLLKCYCAAKLLSHSSEGIIQYSEDTIWYAILSETSFYHFKLGIYLYRNNYTIDNELKQ